MSENGSLVFKRKERSWTKVCPSEKQELAKSKIGIEVEITKFTTLSTRRNYKANKHIAK
jgi:hypothetical protein